MQLIDAMAGLPDGWSVEETGDGRALGRYRTDEGSIDLGCYELAEGIVLTNIDLACPVLPAFNPAGSRMATINWCALGRCEVDFGERGSFVVGKDTLCVSSSMAKAFSYPTGRYQGFELFVDVDRIAPFTWGVFESFGLSEQALEHALLTDGLGTTFVPQGDLAAAVHALEAELSRECPRQNWLCLRVAELLIALAECDLTSVETAGSYLQRSQRDLAQAVYQHLISNGSPEANLGALAERLGVSETSLRGYFSRVYGQTPAAFARARSLAKAAELLARSELTVADVSQACSYANPSKFSAAFKRAYDVNPLEYRRRAKLA